MNFPLNKSCNQLVITQASTQWVTILSHFGINKNILNGKHAPCPLHGGKDGFRFKDEGKGYWVCGTCTDSKFFDGITLIAMYFKLNNKEAFKLVAKYLRYNNIYPCRNSVYSDYNKNKILLSKKKNACMHAAAIIKNCISKPHHYLQNKGLQQPVLVNTKHYQINNNQKIFSGAFIIPIFSIKEPGSLRTVQFINASGSRGYIAGSSIIDGIHILSGSNENYIGIVEGYATGLSLAKATQATIVIAFDAYGLANKAQDIKFSFPGKQLIFFGDNDQVGVKAALKGAKDTKGIVIIPPDTGDWDDYRQKYGLEAMRQEINNQLILFKSEIVK